MVRLTLTVNACDLLYNVLHFSVLHFSPERFYNEQERGRPKIVRGYPKKLQEREEGNRHARRNTL
jgi:hypothetical protein